MHAYIQWNNTQLKKNTILPFATTWMELERITLSEVSWTQKTDTLLYHLHVKSKK